MLFVIFFFKQKTAYEMRISDWSSDVCSSDLLANKHDRTFRTMLLVHKVDADFGDILARSKRAALHQPIEIRDAGLSDAVLIVRHQRISGKTSVDRMDHPGRVCDRAGCDPGDDDVAGDLVVLGQHAHGNADRGHWPAH